MRVAYNQDLVGLLGPHGDIVLLFVAGAGFVTFANETIRAALAEHSLADAPMEDTIKVLETIPGENRERSRVDVVKWRINSVLSWQQIDRRIDELVCYILFVLLLACRYPALILTLINYNRVYEILWSFYRSHNEALLSAPDMTRKFFTEVSRRAIRPTPTDEYVAFGRWITRTPPWIGYSCGGLGQGFFGWTDSEYEDEDEEESDGFFDEA